MTTSKGRERSTWPLCSPRPGHWHQPARPPDCHLRGGNRWHGIADQLRAQMLADGLTEDEARARFWALDKEGLITTDMHGSAARSGTAPGPGRSGWLAAGQRTRRHRPGRGSRPGHPTILIGTSTRSGAFSEEIVSKMAAHVPRPVILPMSNPTELAEARPVDLIKWTTAGRSSRREARSSRRI